MKKLALGAALVAVAVAFVEPKGGPGRRARLLSHLRGLRHRVMHLREQQKPQPNDATLVAKVESEVFRDTEVPSGSVNVNAENGVVVLRGQLESEQLIAQLVAKVRKVQGVQDVESLLHLPGAEAPMHGAHAS